MRLDHLLSKETSSNRELFVTSYGQLSGVEMTFTLFNLEGTRVKKICRRHIFSVYRGGYADAGQVGKK